LSLLVLLAAALPASAMAATHVSVNNNIVRAVSDQGENNQVIVDFNIDNGHIVVEDDVGGVAAVPPCAPVGSGVECPLGGANHAGVVVRPGDGRDLVGEGLLMALVEPFLNAQGFDPILEKLGPGNDRGQAGLGAGRIIGGPGNDRIVGFGGRDTLIGGPGNDVLDRQGTGSTIEPNEGRDRYLAGPGADKIRARDFTRDLRISCGPGRDVLSRDRFDPRPSGCP
jgi:Ca2+-binding RTX toxin-like protein